LLKELRYNMEQIINTTKSWVRHFAVGFSARGPRFNPRPVHVGFLYAVSTIPSMLHSFTIGAM